eukprot:Rmarinus@m.15879
MTPPRKKRCSSEEDPVSSGCSQPHHLLAANDSAYKALSLPDLPSDVLGLIFSKLPCENNLLGAVAKVNREFRKIALEPHWRRCVQRNFVEAHKEHCFKCRRLATQGSASFDDLRSVVKEGRLYCVRCISTITGGKLVHETTALGDTVLSLAVSEGHDSIVRYFTEEVDSSDLISKTDNNGGTVLQKAIRWKQPAMVRYFVEERGAKDLISKANYQGESVLHCAADSGCLDMLRYFVEERGAADLITKADNKGNTVLHSATCWGHLDIVRYIVEERGAADLVTTLNNDGSSVLHVAAALGNLDISRYLLEERGATDLITKKNKKRETALELAECFFQSETAEFLRSKL